MTSPPEAPDAVAPPLDPVTGSAFGRSVVRTAIFNAGATLAAGLAGILIARSLGPSVRGDYAAICVWLIVAYTVGDLGMSAATTYFVARDPVRGRDYLATSRVLTTVAGAAVVLTGFAAAPLLARSEPHLVTGYRITAITCAVILAGFSCNAALQATNIHRWNVVRVAQPALYLVAVSGLHLAGRLDLITALVALLATSTAQTTLAYGYCRVQRLIPGRAGAGLTAPIARYGAGQVANSVPDLAVNRMDQLVLSFTVAPSALGHYAVASSLTNLAVPLVAAVGHVAFPRLASADQSAAGAVSLSRRAIGASAALSVALMAVLAATAWWLVPTVFGADFRDAVTLVWLLAPAAVFMPCSKVCADLLRGHGRPLTVAYVQSAATAVLAVLLAVLVPAFAERGAALAVSVTAAVSFVLMRSALGRLPGRVAAHRRGSRTRGEA
ncbi:hypothetical protein GCM10010435_32760 [Winogradskya consettensis]|uniref:Polysaccharide biosynthesis protein n=1 Tax=Winogradskya consettensis TaxID=113560 RepID=A0A919SEE8_9ACTN|nr:oligosaccharide flippase family protein [Actinoplanes consettensis]GIM70142.1 hypothetical protein Aco04nite_18730 [Actinoplanes consettensis]